MPSSSEMLLPAAARLVLAEAARHGASAFVVPSWDAYRSETAPERFAVLKECTGFSGSFGAALVEETGITLVTDGRYLLQAAAECPPQTRILNVSETPVRRLAALAQGKGQGGVLLDGACWSADEAEAMKREAPEARFMVAKQELCALCVPGFAQAEAAAAAEPVFVQDVAYTGASVAEKLARIRALLHADYYLEPLPEHVAWLLNLRAWDTPYTPAPLARVLMRREEGGAVCYVRASRRVSMEARAALQAAGVEIREESELEQDLQALPASATLQADPKAVSARVMEACRAVRFVPCSLSPCALPQAAKQSAELRGAQHAHEIDGAAVTRALFALERHVERGEFPTEMEISDLFLRERRKHPDFRRESFASIVGVNANGAVIHYRPKEGSCARLCPDAMLLVDSGGQYPYGTTDITRTVCMFRPSEEWRRVFTLVLKGHVALARAVFMNGTSGGALDILARQFLRHEGKDYAHGTGHGVGAFLGVHEGPQRVSARGGDVPLQEGMILSNEPGYYREGAFGIRIENLTAVETRGEGEDGRPLLGFRTLTLAPYDARLVDFEMLDAGEKAWLAAYHARVAASVLPGLDLEDDRARLRLGCAAFGAYG